MPSKKFLEESPLYKPFKLDIPVQINDLNTPAINMLCINEKSFQTFNILEPYMRQFANHNVPTNNLVMQIIYRCASCGSLRYFFVKLNYEEKYIEKVGQVPPWDINPDPTIVKSLGDRITFLKKGLICESQNYGIGSYVYYRRIVEEIIDELLEKVSILIPDGDKPNYSEALEKVKKTIVTQEKIAIVKDLLPTSLRPDGMNPLNILHDSLSIGLHSESDDECSTYAKEIREVLVFLIKQISTADFASAEFTKSMRKLLDKRKS